jgi:hypothetical protein
MGPEQWTTDSANEVAQERGSDAAQAVGAHGGQRLDGAVRDMKGG